LRHLQPIFQHQHPRQRHPPRALATAQLVTIYTFQLRHFNFLCPIPSNAEAEIGLIHRGNIWYTTAWGDWERQWRRNR